MSVQLRHLPLYTCFTTKHAPHYVYRLQYTKQLPDNARTVYYCHAVAVRLPQVLSGTWYPVNALDEPFNERTEVTPLDMQFTPRLLPDRQPPTPSMHAYPDHKCAFGYMLVCSNCFHYTPSHVDTAHPITNPPALGKTQSCELCGQSFVLSNPSKEPSHAK